MEEPRILGVAVTGTTAHMDVDLPRSSGHGASEILRALAIAGLSVQSLSSTRRNRGTRYHLRVLCDDADAARGTTEAALAGGARVDLRHPLTRVCLVGIGLTRSGDVLHAALEALAEADLAVDAVESTDLGIGFHVDPAIAPSVVRVLHDRMISARPGFPVWSGAPGVGDEGAGMRPAALAGGER